jgi:hypothetical protein
LKYLFKNAKGDDGKAKSFKSFDEAIDAAGRLEGCGGITKTSRGYSLRVGPDLITSNPTKISSGMASWIKGVPEVVVAMKVSEESEVTTKKKPLTVTKANGTIKELKQKKKKVKEPEPEPESEDEELDVEEIEIDGVEYYIDESTKRLYDTTTNEVVGKYVDGKIVDDEE